MVIVTKSPKYGQVGLETKGVKVGKGGKSRDGIANLRVNIRRDMVREMALVKGDVVCYKLWKKPKETGPETDEPEEIDTSKIFSTELTEEEKDFILSYRECMRTGNISLLDLVKTNEIERNHLGRNRVKFLIDNCRTTFDPIVREAEAILDDEATKIYEKILSKREADDVPLLADEREQKVVVHNFGMGIEPAEEVSNAGSTLKTTTNEAPILPEKVGFESEIAPSSDKFCEGDSEDITDNEEISEFSNKHEEISELEQKRLDKQEEGDLFE